MSNSPPWLPADFSIPTGLNGATWKLRMLGSVHTERDFDAVMETQERLRRHSASGWPRQGFTLAENRLDLERHEREFAAREAFAYTVLNPEESRVLGCVYLNPSPLPDKDVDVHLWVRETEYPKGLAQELQHAVDQWLDNAWPFKHVNYTRTKYYSLSGRCLCGAVEFEVTGISGPFELCHCSLCRRSTGSAFAAGIRVDAVRFIKGVPQIKTLTLPLRDEPPAYSRVFCRHCGVSVPDPTVRGPQEIPAGTLDGLRKMPDRHIFVDCNAQWAPITDALPQFSQAGIHEFRNSPAQAPGGKTDQ